jgi:large subunit ribosomal protein L1
MSKHGKNYRASKELLGDKEFFTIDEALPLLLQTAKTKFDESCEIHMNLGIDPKHAEQQLRGTLTMPNGTGKKVKIIAIVPDEKVKEAKAAGAVEAGSAELIEKISEGWLDFDVVVAMPTMMKQIGKVAKTLGQKGLMPNPKSGTVTEDIGQVIGEIMKGKIEYRNDKQANLHNIFGKISFGEAKLRENLESYIKTIVDIKPAGIKGVYIQSITLTTSMGPGIHLDVQSATAR